MTDPSASALARWLDLPRLALVCTGLLVAGVAVGVQLGGALPLPLGPGTDQVAVYARTQPGAVRLIATAVFLASIPLACYAAVAGAQLRRLGATRPATVAAVTGGSVAAAALAVTGVLGWVFAGVRADAVLARSVYFLAFLAGGPGHLMALGFLIAGIAAPSLSLGLLPRVLAWSGLVIAALAEVGTLVLAWPPLGIMLPIVRVAALVWLVVAGARLCDRGLES